MAEALLDILKARPAVNSLADSAIVVVDAQREYLDGKLPLAGIEPALQEISALLQRARKCKTPIIFIRHSAGSDSPVFNPNTRAFHIIDEVAPLPEELVIDKNYPNSFAHTNLEERLKNLSCSKLIFTGFMTHACISASVRSAAERGFVNTVVASACATRDLPGTAGGGVVSASKVHDATLAALQDLFAQVVKDSSAIPD